jgi:hypothetical protein
MDNKFEKFTNHKNDDLDPKDIARAEKFEREMKILLNKYNAVIKSYSDGTIAAVENKRNGIILMTF